MTSAIIAVVGTLLGAIVSGIFQQKSAGQSEKFARAERRREEQIAAITALSAAISAHRRAMYMRGEARLRGASAERIQELRAESHATRGDVAEPLARVRLLIQSIEVRTAADAMVDATFGMRRADGTTDAALTREGLTAARQAAADAHDAFISAAAAEIGAAG